MYRWLNGRADFLSPPFFFNQTNTLGYSDAFILDQLIYAPLRVLGAEPLLVLSLIAIVLSAIAYSFLYLLLRRLDVSVTLASLSALIFTFSNNLYLKSWHFQHFAVYYIPIITYCGMVAIGELGRRPIRAYLLGAFAGVLYGLLFSSGYYVAWFFGLALLIFAPIVGFMAWPQVRAWWCLHPMRVFGLGCVSSVGFVAALSLFAVIYAPVLALGAARNFDEFLHYAPQPIDIVNVGKNNLVWSGLIRALHLIPDDELGFGELSTALTPLVQILLLASAILSYQPGFWAADARGRIFPRGRDRERKCLRSVLRCHGPDQPSFFISPSLRCVAGRKRHPSWVSGDGRCQFICGDGHRAYVPSRPPNLAGVAHNAEPHLVRRLNDATLIDGCRAG